MSCLLFQSDRYSRNLRQTFTSTHVTFLSAKEAAEFLRTDSDKYVQSMTRSDLYARKVKTQAEYIQRISGVADDFTVTEKRRIEEHAQSIDLAFPQYASIPWKFIKTRGSQYEDGMPHTREDIILLPDHIFQSPDLRQTLLHEKIHVYQRKNPIDMARQLQQQGYTIVKRRKEEPLARANPDLDEWIYLDPTTKKPMIALYSSSTPTSLNDVSLTNIAFEHPYEAMAYTIATPASSSSTIESLSHSVK